MNSAWGTFSTLVWFASFLSESSSFNIHSIHGPVINPYQPTSSTLPWEKREARSAGGSSGGSAAAVAAGLCEAYVFANVLDLFC